MSDPIYQATGLAKHYGEGDGRVDALKGVDFSIAEGEFLSIIGPSGSGKSTLLGLLGLVAVPTAGILRFRGQDVVRASSAERAQIRRSEIGFVFQSFQLLERTSAVENVELPLIYASVPPRLRGERARAALERVGLSARIHHAPTELSGGEQQRVAIARAIVNQPKVILADEPTGALDTEMGGKVLDILLELNRGGTSLVIITHNPDVAAVAKRRLTLIDGRIEPSASTWRSSNGLGAP